jgi:DNA relaxase NicK
LGFTYFSENPINTDFPLSEVLTKIFSIPDFQWAYGKSGWQGYRHKIQLDVFGLVAFGGASQNNSVHVELSGTGCRQVKDWTLVHDWLETTDSRIIKGVRVV